jgi:hypothetical protein
LRLRIREENMADITPSVLANAILGKLYDVLTPE